MSGVSPRIAAVVVSWNRRDNVLRWIESLLSQTRPVDEILVVDNGSSDDTVQAVRDRHPTVRVVETGQNLGHAGGAQAGMAEAFRRGHDWFWMFDDDAFPEPRALERSLRAIDDVRDRRPAVIYAPSQELAGWQWRGRKFPVRFGAAETRSGAPIPVALVDFNMSLVAARMYADLGPPRGDYFMMGWEIEYCLRAIRAGYTNWVVPEVLVRHEHAGFQGQATWRAYYQTRNHVAMVRESFNLRDAWWCGVRQARLVAAAMLRVADNSSLLAMRLKGVCDGLTGRMGRRVDPAAFRGRGQS